MQKKKKKKEKNDPAPITQWQFSSYKRPDGQFPLAIAQELPTVGSVNGGSTIGLDRRRWKKVHEEDVHLSLSFSLVAAVVVVAAF